MKGSSKEESVNSNSCFNIYAEEESTNSNSCFNIDGREYISVKHIEKEWKILKENLPEKIFVRAYKPMRELLRAVIIGAEGTPYHDGLFFFDVCMPGGYVTSFSPEPRVRYHWHHSDCLSINPHIYASGEVSLSLSRRARNGKIDWEEIWVPGTSNVLQLLVCIQDVLLNTHPLLNYVYYRSHFEELVVGHFRSRVRHILTSCKGYVEGLFLEGKKEERCSMEFRKDVASYIKPLVDAFIKIGAKEAHEFLYLCESKGGMYCLLAQSLGAVTTGHHSASLSIKPTHLRVGEVSLSLSRRARNGKIDWEEIWVPGTSNVLQLLVCIQDVLLNTHPLLNYVYYRSHFEELVVGHFRSRVRHILTSCKGYVEGLFLEGKKEERCSMEFRKDVASYIKPLVDAFIKIGAKEAHEFLYLCESKVPLLH
ncbi:ubiquitin-conjugating enzyme/RWD-like protein [Artemisia annua]|uniref:Ubiquitin-conjugating enzyme/RWD-like protein n=1 Tax=Artemisia annua TaxID=35608 RepID=A0A2U1MRM7_ARTAN|nr:ubiquitin-conjugating enzyme/RWD-like protein [Artemisia annua]